MGFVADEHDPAVPFGSLGGEEVGGLGHQLGFEVAGLGAEGAHDGDVEAAGAEGGVGDVDDLVAGAVQGVDGGAHGHGLAGADVAGDDPEGGLDDTEVDAGDGLGVGLSGEEVLGGDRLAEGGALEPEVGGPRGGAHRVCSSSSGSANSPSWEKSILEPVPACSSWAAATRPR